MFTGLRFVVWRAKLPRATSWGCLSLAALLFACQAPDETVGPGSNDPPGAPSNLLSADQLLALTTPPGLRWFRDHTHSAAPDALAAQSQMLSFALAASISPPTDLGTSFPSNTASLAVAINASGQLAGWTAVVTGGESNAIRWDASGTPIKLPTITSAGVAGATDLNDAGVVVGYDLELDEQFGWRRHAMRWNPDGSFSVLPWAPGARDQGAEAISANGVIVGYTQLVSEEARAVRWDAHGVHILPSEGRNAVAVDVNDRGMAVGHVYGTDNFIRPAVWSAAGTLTVLPLPPGDNFGFAAGINNLGQVVGTSGISNGPDLTHHAVIWAPDGTPTVIPSSDLGQGWEINEAGVVVGYVEDASPDLPGATGVIWIDGKRIFAPPSPSARTSLNDLSETQLAGAFYPNSQVHAARWSFTTSGSPFPFSGFFPPVRNPGATAPYVLNKVQAGQAVPVKFSLKGDKGLDVLARGYPRSKPVSCTLSSTEGGQPTRTAGKARLSYHKGADQYSYTWKTEKAWAGTCRQLMVGLSDGTIHTALFRFK